ncbi:hypothetical protein PAP_09845 [Palaeococcus pacificus DY20341]|uniref:Phosphodiesterase n=1 Tax=Palaeococcus pacificus DY20341 TaxID=1343739 RepID=A0A075LVH6_9EURY|nr:alkaline phosphatase family protein [Palaeococcus pacificus]AIF70344.1 hypothetical protein PAP_09845 [Palaeococcus pacificus DY20341]
MNEHLKIVIIGLDGASKTTVQLVGLKKDTIYDFISTIPPYTPPAWTSIFTGVNPAKHGIIGWQKIDINTLKTKLVTSHDVKYSRLSELLDTSGLKSIVINLPMTYPFSGIVNKNNTIIVSDWAAPEQTIYPKKLSQTYKEYLINPPHDWASHIENKKEYASLVKEYIQIRLNFYYELLEKEDWDLFFVVFSETDWFSHIYPHILEGKDKGLVAPIFKILYKFIQDAQETADITFVVSDHGFEIKNKVFYVNSALAKGGFISYSKTKLKLARLVNKVFPKSLLKRAVESSNAPSNILEATLNPEKTHAFMPPEPTTWGMYTKDASIKEKVKQYLQNFEEIKTIVESSKLYNGPHVDNLPSLFIIPAKGVEYSYKLSEKITEAKYMADHEIHGIFSVTGKGISEDINFSRLPTVYDIAPTILHIFGLPIPNDMDGRVLIEIFEEDSEFAKRKPKYVDPSYYEKRQEDEKLKKAIKNLKLKGKI